MTVADSLRTVAARLPRPDSVRCRSPIPMAAISASSIGDALRRLDDGSDAVVVQDPTGCIIGWVRHRDMLAAMTGSSP